MALCTSLPCVSHCASSIRKAGDIHGAFSSNGDSSRPFDLTGTIDAFDPAGFVLADETGAYSLSTTGCGYTLSGGDNWTTGHIVKVKGGLFPAANGMQTIGLVTGIQIIGKGDVRKPVDAAASDIACGMHDYSTVRLTGVAMACKPDEIDPHWSWLLLRTTSATAKISIRNADFSDSAKKSYIDALITVTGTALPSRGKRRFADSRVFVPSPDSIVIVKPADADPFDKAPRIRTFSYFRPRTVAELHRNRISGLVVANWDNGKFLLQTAGDEPLFVDMMSGTPPPERGSMVKAVGFITPNVSTLRMSEAIFKNADLPKLPMPEAIDITAEQLVFDTNGNRRVKIGLNGRLIRMQGKVQSVPDGMSLSDRLHMLSGKLPISVYIGNTPLDRWPKTGDTIEVTGICHMSFLSISPHTDYSNIGGIEIIPGDGDGIKTISQRPWWTPARFTLVATMLLLLLSGSLIWNRVLKRLAERRGRALFRERIAHATAELRVAERTRLAIELHDSIAQSLTGVAFHVTAADKALKSGKDTAIRHIDTATKILQHSRVDLRRCIWDLRNDALELDDFAEAIRRTAMPVLDDAEIDIDFRIPRKRMSDSTAHTILSVIRELTSNSVRHGNSGKVLVSGKIENGRLIFSVKDNGSGFPAAEQNVQSTGHFGLDGITERIRRLNGTVTIGNLEGGGAAVTISIPLPGTEGVN